MSLATVLSRKTAKSSARALYVRINEQARNPRFFQSLGVADTIDGRFDLVILHVFLVLRRIGLGAEATQGLRQELFNAMFANMDGSLRQMGVGDLSVGKKIKKMATAFYGRVEAYETALADQDRDALTQAIVRNLFRGDAAKEDAAHAISGYMLAAWSDLSAQPLERFCLGLVNFIEPASAPELEPAHEA